MLIAPDGHILLWVQYEVTQERFTPQMMVVRALESSRNFRIVSLAEEN